MLLDADGSRTAPLFHAHTDLPYIFSADGKQTEMGKNDKFDIDKWFTKMGGEAGAKLGARLGRRFMGAKGAKLGAEYGQKFGAQLGGALGGKLFGRK